MFARRFSTPINRPFCIMVAVNQKPAHVAGFFLSGTAYGVDQAKRA